MRALVAENGMARLAATKLLSMLSPRAFLGPTSPVRLREVPDPVLPAPTWAIARTELCGLCGSDAKQVFMNGSIDNPMTGYISWPQVMGHEVMGVIDELGPEAAGLEIGQRVVLNPWLSCEPRGLPLCAWCERGDLAQCESFLKGEIGQGLHNGNCAAVSGGFAPRVPAHASQWIPIPDSVSDETAVLADPFGVALHAILRTPPPPGGQVLVYGCGTLGLLTIQLLRALHPDVGVAAIARFPHQAELAREFGAAHVLPHHPPSEILEQASKLTGAELVRPWKGLPVLNGGVDVVVDTVASPETLEVGLRLVRSRGSIVVLGVEPSRRFEWTPLYFKEVSIVGSNGFGIETWQGRR